MKHKKAVFVPRREQISCRIEKENPLTDSPLVTLPDYTFMDGRPTPLGVSFQVPLLSLIFPVLYNDTLFAVQSNAAADEATRMGW